MSVYESACMWQNFLGAVSQELMRECTKSYKTRNTTLS